MSGAWGSGSWGGGSWGGGLGPGGPLELVGALAVAENVVRLTFSLPVYFSGILDQGDASNRHAYAVAANPATTGYDGTPARAVGVASVAVAQVAGLFLGQVLDVTLDRPMTPFPAGYSVTAAGLVSADLTAALTAPATAPYQGIHKALVPPSLDAPSVPATRDLANPQTLSGAVAAKVSVPALLAALGTFPVDATGDYAYDQGLDGYRKRVLRVLVTAPGGYLHLGDGYGVGVGGSVKKLASAANRARLASRAQAQILKDPMTAACTVTVQRRAPGLYYLVVLARTKSGETIKYSSPLGTQVGAAA